MPMSEKDAQAAIEALAKQGIVIDTGQRRRCPETGEMLVVWMINPKLSAEEVDALIERPAVMN
jgi:hypothetical protein